MFPRRRRRRRLHLLMATFIYFMIPTFIYRCVHPISWWRRSSVGAFIYLTMTTFLSLNIFRYTIMTFPLGIVVLNALFPSTATFERKLWTEALLLFCCCRRCGLLLARFACGGFVFGWFCFLALCCSCCLCSSNEAYRITPSGSSRINNCNVFSTTFLP